MHSHLAIIGTNGELALKPDTSLNVTDKNPMFNDVEMFTQTIPLPFDLNRRVLKNMDDVNSTLRSADVQGERFQFVLDGIPFRNTAIKIQEGTKLNGTIDVNFDATNRTFKDMIADMRCRDVTVDDDILIGEKIDNVQVFGQVTEKYHIHCLNGDTRVGWCDLYITAKTTDMNSNMFSPTATDYSFPGKCSGNFIHPVQDTPRNVDGKEIMTPVVATSYINVSRPYGDASGSPHKDKNGATIGWPYCNSRICYAHYDVEHETVDGNVQDKIDEKTGSKITSDDIVTSDRANPSNGYDFSPYWMLPADRPASGLCFYVAYFLEKLFKTLGVAYDMTALTNIADFNYLCFFSTGCHYVTRSKPYGEDQALGSRAEINDWLRYRGLGGRISVDYDRSVKGLDDIDLAPGQWTGIEYSDNVPDAYKPVMNPETDRFHAYKQSTYAVNFGAGIWADNYSTLEHYYEANYEIVADVVNMFATSDNFPDATVSEVIESLENSFGVRFVYDAEINKVTVKLLRDMFRDQQAPIPFKGTVLKMVKMTENIRGIRMNYSAEQNKREQQNNLREHKYDYETNYNYIDYQEGRVELRPYSDIVQLVDIGNKTCYTDMDTGDAFRIKVNSEATNATELRPSVFEVGALHGVELGDCSEQADKDDAIKDFTSNFEPVITNILKDDRGNIYLVPFIDEKMDHELTVKKIQNVFSISSAFPDDYIYLNYELSSLEAYDPSQTDDGLSPLMTHEWGLAIGFLRPAVNGSGVYEYDRGYDGFDNSRWGIQSSDYCVHSDSYDITGRFLGTSHAGSFSLKPRAWKPFRYKYVTESGQQVLKISTDPKQWENDPSWLIPCNEDERDAQTSVITKRIRSRGMCDTWMIEFFTFLLQRQKYYVEALCTAAELADIPNKWLRRWEIDGKVGWINILTYPIDVKTGLGKVEMEFFAL